MDKLCCVFWTQFLLLHSSLPISYVATQCWQPGSDLSMACWSAVISVWTAVPGKTHESGFANFRGTLPSARRLALRLRQQWSFVVFCTQQRCLPFTLAGFPVSAARGELLGFPVGRSSSICFFFVWSTPDPRTDMLAALSHPTPSLSPEFTVD